MSASPHPMTSRPRAKRAKPMQGRFLHARQGRCCLRSASLCPCLRAACPTRSSRPAPTPRMPRRRRRRRARRQQRGTSSSNVGRAALHFREGSSELDETAKVTVQEPGPVGRSSTRMEGEVQGSVTILARLRKTSRCALKRAEANQAAPCRAASPRTGPTGQELRQGALGARLRLISPGSPRTAGSSRTSKATRT